MYPRMAAFSFRTGTVPSGGTHRWNADLAAAPRAVLRGSATRRAGGASESTARCGLAQLDRPVSDWHTICVNTKVDPADEEFEAAAHVLKLLADPTRLRILWALLHGEHSVNDLADHVGARPTAASQHLAKLRLARLVRTRRDGN